MAPPWSTLGTNGRRCFATEMDGDQQLAHGGDDRELAWFAPTDQTLVVGAQPGISLRGHQCGHPEVRSELCVAELGHRRATRARAARLIGGGDYDRISWPARASSLLFRYCT